MNFRQVHLDFHTSECIDHIGVDFNKDQFQKNLKAGHINSITLFSKCHHGWAYHPSTANTIHPHLSFDLLGKQIEAAHELGIKTPVYISAGLDEKLARKHPEWLFRNKDESTTWVTSFNEPGYHVFCFNTPYLDILLKQIEEVVTNYDADGIFLDIVHPKPCYCQNCITSIMKEGKDPYDEATAAAFGESLYAFYAEKVRETIDKIKPGLPVFHNGGHIPKGRHDLSHMNSHLELESLPTGGWGYDHFPASAKYVINEDLEFLGMTGKFHTTWGEFGGYKSPNALLYETSLTLAMGGKCSIGDQLHPRGMMDPHTYKIIGQAYGEVEKKEPWCDQVTNVADIAILSAESIQLDSDVFSHKDKFPIDTGANRMLLQSHYLYELIDPQMDFTRYKVLILPDTIRCDSGLKEKLKAYLDRGGKLLLSGESGMSTDKDAFCIDIGCEWISHQNNQPNYYRSPEDSRFMEASSYIMYSPSEKVRLTDGTSAGFMEDSYFNRSTFEFCSHQHAPSTLQSSGPGMVTTDNTVYVPWKVFSEYADIASLHLRDMVTMALNHLLSDEKTLDCNLPAQGITTLMKQEAQHRYILHLLYASPVLRGFSPKTQKNIEVIEDLIPIHDTTIRLKLEEQPTKVYLAPSMKALEFNMIDDVIAFKVDRFTCHEMVVIDYI